MILQTVDDDSRARAYSFLLACFMNLHTTSHTHRAAVNTLHMSAIFLLVYLVHAAARPASSKVSHVMEFKIGD